MSDDLISRQAAIDAFYKCPNINWTTLDVLAKIKELPSAERRGKWVPYEFGNRLWHKCTACGVADKYIDQVTRANGTICELVAKRPYCPNCGAKMEGYDE